MHLCQSGSKHGAARALVLEAAFADVIEQLVSDMQSCLVWELHAVRKARFRSDMPAVDVATGMMCDAVSSHRDTSGDVQRAAMAEGVEIRREMTVTAFRAAHLEYFDPLEKTMPGGSYESAAHSSAAEMVALVAAAVAVGSCHSF